MQNKEIELKFGFDGDARNLHQVFAKQEVCISVANTIFQLKEIQKFLI